MVQIESGEPKMYKHKPELPARSVKKRGAAETAEARDVRKYVFFPFLDEERADRLLKANRFRSNNSKPPYTVIFEDRREETMGFFAKKIMARSEKLNISKEDAPKLASFSGSPDLSNLSPTDKVYINAHGKPGKGYFYGSNHVGKRSAQEIAKVLVEKLKLPPFVEIRLSVCHSASVNTIEIAPQSTPEAAYTTIEADRGSFEDSLAGIFEKHLRKLQPTRERGTVSGYSGATTFYSPDEEKVKYARTADGKFKSVKEHSFALFYGKDKSKFEICFRKSDLRRTSNDQGQQFEALNKILSRRN